MSNSIDLNSQTWQLTEEFQGRAEALGVSVAKLPCGAEVFDCGVTAPGGWEAGRLLAEICMAGLGRVELRSAGEGEVAEQIVAVEAGEPLASCLYSQYAGWQIAGDGFFAMGSGPMRLHAAKEPLFTRGSGEWRERWITGDEQHRCAVGVLETSKLPPDAVALRIAEDCGVPPEGRRLPAAPTARPAGTLRVVGGSLGAALHKLHEIGFDVASVERGTGFAPCPPVAANDLAAIGWTNDAILYGAEVTLELRAEDEQIVEFGPRVPAEASRDYGRPFAEIFAEYDGDFYAIDPLLFSPARVTFKNLASGNTFRFGQLRPEILTASWRS